MIIVPSTPSTSGFSNTVINLVEPLYQKNLSHMEISPDGSIICAAEDGSGTINIFSVGTTDSYLTYKLTYSNGIFGLTVTSNKVFAGIYTGIAGFSTSSPYGAVGYYNANTNLGITPLYGQPAVNAAGTKLWAGQNNGQTWIGQYSLSATNISYDNVAQFSPPGNGNWLISTPDTSNSGQTILYFSHTQGLSRMKTADNSITSLQYSYGGRINLNSTKDKIYAVSYSSTVRVIDTFTFTQIASTTASALGVAGITSAVPNRSGDKIYVTHSAGIAVLDSATLSVVASISKNHLDANLGAVNDIRFNPAGTKAYATTNGGLLVII